MAQIAQKIFNRLFAVVEAAAINNERAPQLSPHGILSVSDNRALLMMARAGRLRIEIFAYNWRVITICEGPNKGRQTLRSPHKGSNVPYKIIYKDHVVMKNAPITNHVMAATDDAMRRSRKSRFSRCVPDGWTLDEHGNLSRIIDNAKNSQT